jgi:hypothetical protein
MDIGLATFLFSIRKQHFADTPSSSTPKGAPNMGLSAIICFIITLAIGGFAVYLSWTCNTKGGTQVPEKILWGLFAFIFGFLYLLWYLIARSGRCGLK